MLHFLDFEKPIAELEGKIEELRRMSEPDGLNIADEITRLTAVADKQLRTLYGKLTPWQKTLVARHPDRPKACDYISGLVTDFTRRCISLARLRGSLSLYAGVQCSSPIRT